MSDLLLWKNSAVICTVCAVGAVVTVFAVGIVALIFL